MPENTSPTDPADLTEDEYVDPLDDEDEVERLWGDDEDYDWEK